MASDLQYIPFWKNVDDLLAQDEGGVVQDGPRLHAPFADCQFAVEEEAGQREEPGLHGDADAEHEHDVQDRVGDEEQEGGRGAPLQPGNVEQRDAQHEEDHVQAAPLEA